MKLSPSDILAILRRFAIADDSNVPRQIERVKSSNPQPTNLLVSFRFLNRDYAILIDDSADDDTEYIVNQIAISLPGRTGQLISNPASDVLTYGYPYKAKDVYLFSFGNTRQRLDSYLADTHPDTSRSSWQKHIKAGRVLVNSRVETLPKALLNDGDQVDVNLPATPDYSDRSLDIVYIDDDVLVVDKPIGILTHRKNDIDEEFTVADFLLRYITEPASNIRSGVVHRLDRDTSGLIIAARHQAAYDHLKAQFAERSVDKSYVAITDGVPKQAAAHIDLPIARNRTSPGSFIVNSQGKPAQTDYQVVATQDDMARIILQPRTGRTHQLRVHMTYIGTPIHGDRLYGKPADRLYLHAQQLGLTLPNGKTETFRSPVPPEFDQLVTESKS